MGGPLDGVRVVEVASWTFVPAAGAILADLGADVIKIEPPTGDPQRALQNLLNFGVEGPNPFLEIPNRGKRSVCLDLRSDAGHEVLLRIVKSADVFLTSNLPAVRERLRIDVEDIRAANPDIIYVRGTGWGSKGPMTDVGGYDLAAGWATSGLAYRLSLDGNEPPMQPAAFFDLQGANTIAGSIGIALYEREKTGHAPIVDVSLMNVGMWPLAPDIVAAPYTDMSIKQDREQPGNPIVNWYQTKDGRWLYLVCLQGDRFWTEVCAVVGRPELIEDPRFVDAAARFEHRTECVHELDAAFAKKTLAEWQTQFADFTGVWAPVQSFKELHDHPQVVPNGYLPEVTSGSGASFRLVAAPMHYDESAPVPRGPAPELGQHTELVLLDIGLDWPEISAYRERGAMGEA